MKKTTALALLAALILGSTPAFAGHHEKGGPEGHHGPKFEVIDTNKDGFLTRDEMEAHHRKKMDGMFEKADTDKDGKLSKEELKKGLKEWRGKMKGHCDKMKKKDGDKEVKEEGKKAE